MRNTLALLAGLVLASTVNLATAEPLKILFVGNSYPFGRVDPVMSYNAAQVDDMTRPRPDLPGEPFTVTTGTRPWEPHPWGGVPGIFKQFAAQAGLDVEVALSTRNAASLRGHYFYSDYCSGWLRSFRLDGNEVRDARQWPVDNVGSVLSFGEDASGELYLLSTGGGGSVYRLVRRP